MKAYKGFTKDMKCRDFQYEEGKEYVHDGKVSVCKSGFHACERPLACFNYYSPSESVYHEVEINGDVSKATDDSKVAGSKIKVGARLNILGLVKAQFEYVKLHTINENTDPATANAGDCGAASAGDQGAARAGDQGAAISRGSSSVGANGVALVRGDSSYGNKAKGGIGAILIFILEEENSYKIEDWKAVVVDGETIKADTWYKLENGNIIEVVE